MPQERGQMQGRAPHGQGEPLLCNLLRRHWSPEGAQVGLRPADTIPLSPLTGEP